MYSGAYKQIPSIKLSVYAVFAKLTMLCILVFSDEIFGTIYYCGSNTKYVNNCKECKTIHFPEKW